ncbi:cupin domain-containing protein [Asaia prunellae]|uniref:cupin domain-containing protein n=1 Tax=Asaia prunellae TaxID=610245 RepID=UPI0004708687|nr:cupin domain-containing protein [Asaia prunellae]
MTITKIEINKSISDLDAWGRFSDLGAEILEGDVLAYGKMTYGAPTDPINAAYFGTTKGKFRLVYPFSEQATLIRGEIILTDETTGQSKHYKPGDSWFVTKGTPTLWEIITENFTKHYLAFA